MKNLGNLLLVFLLGSAPLFAKAEGLVPCGGDGEPACQWTHVPILINNVVDWIVAILTLAVVIILVYAGFLLVTSGGSQNARQDAKKYISNALIGFVIVLAAWLVIDTVIKVLVSPSGNLPNGFGPWNEIPQVIILSPTDRGRISSAMLFQGTEAGGRMTAYEATLDGVPPSTLTDAQAADRAALSDSYADQLCAEAARYAVLQDKCNVVRALVAQESGGDPTAESSAGAAGLMQIMPDTARSLHSEFADLTNEEIKAELKRNPDLSIKLGTEMLAGAVDKYDSVELALAAYNGGTKANRPSNNCSGKLRWQCKWDGSDCLDGVGSDCKRNTGYQETRGYVSKVIHISEQYDS